MTKITAHLILRSDSRQKKTINYDFCLNNLLICSCCIANLLLLWWNTGKVSDRFCGKVSLKGGLRGNSIIIDVITIIHYRYNYMQVFL